MVAVLAKGIAVDPAAVTKPLALTVKLGTVTLSPKLPTLVLTVARVSAPLTFALPSTLESVADASPVKFKLRAVAHFVAVAALPTNSA